MNWKLYYSRVHGQIHLAAQFTSGVLSHFQNAPLKAGFLVLKGQKMIPPCNSKTKSQRSEPKWILKHLITPTFCAKFQPNRSITTFGRWNTFSDNVTWVYIFFGIRKSNWQEKGLTWTPGLLWRKSFKLRAKVHCSCRLTFEEIAHDVEWPKPSNEENIVRSSYCLFLFKLRWVRRIWNCISNSFWKENCWYLSAWGIACNCFDLLYLHRHYRIENRFLKYGQEKTNGLSKFETTKKQPRKVKVQDLHGKK